MGFYYSIQLHDRGHTRTIFRCKDCYSHLFTSSNVTSNEFSGKNGKAFLINKLVNYKTGAHDHRHMMTGEYKVCDAICQQCDAYLGWKYLIAEEYEEKYKEGNFVIEMSALEAFDSEKRKLSDICKY